MTVHAYLLRCRDGSFYAGHTENLELRIAQHEQGVTGGYTATRRPVVLVWTEILGHGMRRSLPSAVSKGWSRATKQALIDGDWERLKRLARNRQNQ
ncbi:MAG: GIY-YIG nuclease family protein [Sphingomonadaceae bacterium]|nr:GIY-YIG nuclease family protein [Sphingomonadaceae bacterium]